MKGDNSPPRWLVEDVQTVVERLMLDGHQPLHAVRLVVSALAFVAGSVTVAGFERVLDAASWDDLVASLVRATRARRRR